MVYTEVKERNGKKYFYRVLSVRKGSKVNKIRKYLGVNLDKKALNNKEFLADKKFKDYKTTESIKAIEGIIINVLKKYNIRKASIFGSYARGEQKKDSDIDILIEPARGMSLLDISGLKIELERVLNRKVDIVSYKYIHPYLKDNILKSEVKII
jgi:hypothetical protein